MKVNQIIDEVIRVEGGYVNNPADRGGETNYGITVAVARENGYLGPMADLPRSVAFTIYERRYVIRPGFDKVLALDTDIGEELIDTGVNMGPAVAGMFLQRWLNAFNCGELFVDGAVGNVTIAALKKFLAWRKEDGKKVLLRALNGVQAERYLSIAERDKSQRQFIYGWILNRVK